jgi:hypothetical protein
MGITNQSMSIARVDSIVITQSITDKRSAFEVSLPTGIEEVHKVFVA